MAVLKYYHEYLRRIEAYAEATGVNIKYGPEDGEGSFSPRLRRVKIDPDLSESREIAVLLHELGHSLDETLLDNKTENKLDKAYSAIYDHRHNKKQLKAVLECEKRAWTYARSIAKRLKIRLGAWFDRVEKDCIDAYKD